nr:alpha/beta hydrolase [Xanthomonas campestris]
MARRNRIPGAPRRAHPAPRQTAQPRAFWRQLQAIKAWARQPAQDLTRFTMPVLITAGDHDRLVPPVHSEALARRIPHAQLIVYQDAGHGAAFQYHAAFVASVLAFLDR